MEDGNGKRRLQFACECVSSEGGYGDPWAPVAQNGLLPDGTKEKIVNLVASEPRTIAQLAKELGMSKPTVHQHLNEMLASELVRESAEFEKRHPVERYYEPNFPVVTAREREEFEGLCREMAEKMAALYESYRDRLGRSFEQTTLDERGWAFEDVEQYLFAKAQRSAREILEERDALPRRRPRRNGLEWVFWAEESLDDDADDRSHR
jgi:DNA-binding transcriptional ArsR family regulator